MLGLWVNVGSSDFATDSKGLLAQCFVYFGTLFSDSFLDRFFCRSRCFSVPKLGLGVVFDAAKNDATKGFGGIPENFRKWGDAL